MPKNPASPEEELTRSFSRMLNMSLSVPHMLEMARLMADTLSTGSDEQAPANETSNRSRGAKEPVGLVIKANATLLTSAVRFWLRWQELVSKHVPTISRNLADIQANPKRKEELRALLIDNMRAYTREMAELPCEQCRLVRQDLEKMEAQLFGAAQEKEGRRRWKAKP